MQCWRQWQETIEENKAARVALSFFANIATRKAFNQWLTWAQERQEYGAKLHLAVQVGLSHAPLSSHHSSQTAHGLNMTKKNWSMFRLSEQCLLVFEQLPVLSSPVYKSDLASWRVTCCNVCVFRNGAQSQWPAPLISGWSIPRPHRRAGPRCKAV